MLLIVAHHYVVNSGLFEAINDSPFSPSTATLLVFGAWGKTGINCFMLITGYFMCRSTYSLRKVLKLYLQMTFYALVIYGIFCFSGHENFSLFAAAGKLFPVKSISDGFSCCILIFYLLIPFINILVHGMNRRQHLYLMAILLFVYTIMPGLNRLVTFNYVTWFSVLYLISSYIRLYGLGFELKARTWGAITILLAVVGTLSILIMYKYFLYAPNGGTRYPYWFLADSNKPLALAIGLTSFLWFKGIKIPYSRIINTIGATTFGVLLIHADSDTMRQWLWRETVDPVGHLYESALPSLGYALTCVAIIFTVCSCIDWLRARYIEPGIMSVTDRLINTIKSRKRSDSPTGLVNF